MALQCDLDLGLKALEEKKKSLKDKLSNLADVSGLSDIKTAADEQLQALKDALPEIPEIPDFQKDFDNLKTELLSGFTNPLEQNEKLNTLKKNWGKAVDNIDEILDVLQNPLELLKIDPCAKPDPAKGDIVIPDISKEADGSKKEISRSFERFIYVPFDSRVSADGKTWTHTATDMSSVDSTVKAIAESAWTDDVKTAYKTHRESQSI